MHTSVEQTSGTRRSSQVLVAEGDKVSLHLVQQLLTKSGYDIVVANDGPQALQILDSDDPPSLAVLGWTMPGLNGPDLCRQLRKTRHHLYTYVVLLTSWTEQDRRDEALQAGADDCLFKPVDMRELRLRLQIGARAILERELRESQDRFRTAFESAGIGMAVSNLAGKFVQVNRALCHFLGQRADDLRALSLEAVSYPEDSPKVSAVLQGLLRGEAERCELERRFVHKSGQSVWGLLTASVAYDADRNPTGFVAQVQDLTERKQAEAALKAAHAETELFLRSVPSILIGLDSSGRITRWNLTAVNTFGIEEARVRGRKLEDCGVKWLHPDFKLEVSRWLQTETSCRCDTLAYEWEHKHRFLGLHVQRIASPGDAPAGVIVTGADITERKGLEDQLRQAQKLEAIGQLAAGIAHEINTPMQYVGDNTRFVKDSWECIAQLLDQNRAILKEAETGPVSPESLAKLKALSEQSDIEYLGKEIPHAIEQSLEGVQRVAKIVRAMKEFSHPGTEEKRAVDINKAIETTITVARNEWKYVAEVVTRFDDAIPLVPCLVGELNQVILNLIINAAHAIAGVVADSSKQRGTITISTRRDGPWAEIAIRDTGTGIPKEIRSRIFEPFFTTKAVGKGTGQGLALAHSVVVNRHQGQLWFESEEGRGTTFFIRLPLGAVTS